ncbi:MAG: metallophosphoesterase family protein [Acidobacteriota bacterium]
MRPVHSRLIPLLFFALATLPGLSQSTTFAPTLTFPQFAHSGPTHIIAYGDSRFTDPAVTTGTNPRVRAWLAAHIGEAHPQVLLLTGDTPYTGAKASDWKDFHHESAPWRKAHILVLPTIGNHEIYGGIRRGIANYMAAFPQLAGHRYYSALLGNVEVISLDCNLPASGSAAQVRWFAGQLDHLPAQVDFLLILYHTPWMNDRQTQVFLDLPSKDALQLRGILEQRIPRIRARVVVFNGHIHNYERFERSGAEFVVTGGGGAQPYPLLYRGKADLYRDPAFPVYHYVDIQIANRQLHATMWKIADPEAANFTVEAKDQFTLTAPPPAKPPATP